MEQDEDLNLLASSLYNLLGVIFQVSARLAHVALPRRARKSTQCAHLARSGQLLHYLPMRRLVACNGTWEQVPEPTRGKRFGGL